jgi:hypothetical protein
MKVSDAREVAAGERRVALGWVFTTALIPGQPAPSER